MSHTSADIGLERQRGFALLVSLIAIVGLTALATGGFLLANSERKVSSNHEATVEAFYLANAGLSDYLANQSGTPPAGPTTYPPVDYPDGSASVTVTQVATAPGTGSPGVYLVASQGRYAPNGTANPVTRTVSRVALLDPAATPPIQAAYAAGAGMRKNGGSGEINGNDQCGQQSARAGVRVPVDGYDQQGNGDVVHGDPPVEEVSDPLDLNGDGTTEDERQWWGGMQDGTAVSHDYVIDDAGDDFPDTSSDSDMPVTYVDQDSYSLGSGESGKGLLIIRGNVSLGGGFEWDGIILVGGSVTDNGIGEIEGAIMTGLNELNPDCNDCVAQDDLDNDTNDEDTLNGTKKFLFDSCFVQEVFDDNAVLAELPGTWHERI